MSRWLQANYKREADVTTDLKRAINWLKDKAEDLPEAFRQKFITDPWNAAKEFLLGTESEKYRDNFSTNRDSMSPGYNIDSFYDRLFKLLKFRYLKMDEYTTKEHFDKFPTKIIPVGSDQVFVKDDVDIYNEDFNTVSKKSKSYDYDDNYRNEYDALGDKKINNQLLCYYKADTSNFNGDITNAPSGAIYADEPEYFYWKVGDVDGPWREKSKYRVVEY